MIQGLLHHAEHPLGRDLREVQNHPKCISRTWPPLVEEKEDAKGFYLGAKTL
jgi:hypothetical protein